MGLCGNAFERLGAMLSGTLSKPDTRTIKVKCPDCGKEFEISVSQQISGSINDFSPFLGESGGLNARCPWTKQ